MKLISTSLVVAMTLLAAPVRSDEGNVNDTTDGLVYEKLADFMVACEELRSRPYSCIASGESLVISNDGKITKKGVYRISAQDKVYKYDASAEVFDVGMELWSQRIVGKGETHYRSGPASRNLPAIKMNDDTPEEERFKMNVRPLSPIADMIAMVGNIDDGKANPRIIERVFLQHAELRIAKFNKKGQIESKWDLIGGESPAMVQIIWDNKYSFMPSEAKYFVTLNGEDLPVSHSECSYKKHGVTWLPDHYSGVSFRFDESEKRFVFDFQWTTEDKLEESFINPSLVDWRSPFRSMFEINWKLPSILGNR